MRLLINAHCIHVKETVLKRIIILSISGEVENPPHWGALIMKNRLHVPTTR